MDELTSWLRERLDHRERAAKAATAGPWWHDPGKVWLDPEAFVAYDRSKGHEFVGYGESPFSGCIAATGPSSHMQSMADAQHIALNDPAAVLADIAAKRAILDLHAPQPTGPTWDPGPPQCGYCAEQCHSRSGLSCDSPDAPYPCPTVRMLASAYASEPGYREEWRP